MRMLLAFAPFIAFALVDRLAGSLDGLVAGAAMALLLLTRDAVTPGRSAKLLEIGTAVLFCGLALYAALAAPDWSVIGVRLLVDGGLLLLVLASMGLRRPFTLQYARERTPRAVWDTPEFIRTNYAITAAWALAFAVMVVAEAALLLFPGMPRRTGVIVIVLALLGAFKFSAWYPARQGPTGTAR